MDVGYIQLHRKLKEWEWYHNSKMVHLFIHLLLSANHQDNNWQGIEIKRGELLTGRKELAKQTGISQRSCRTCLTRLKTTNEVTIKSTNKYSIIFLCNYEKYQSEKKKTTSKTTSKLANERPANDQQTTTNNNDNNDNNDNKEIHCETSSQEEFNFLLLKEKMEKSEKDPRMPIIALYWTYKGIDFKNKDQYTAGLKRELRAAQNLRGYDLKRIKEVMFALNGTGIDWTLETTHKYADRDLTKLNNFNK